MSMAPLPALSLQVYNMPYRTQQAFSLLYCVLQSVGTAEDEGVGGDSEQDYKPQCTLSSAEVAANILAHAIHGEPVVTSDELAAVRT